MVLCLHILPVPAKFQALGFFFFFFLSKKTQGHAEESLNPDVKDHDGPVKLWGFLSSEGPGNISEKLCAIDIGFRSKYVSVMGV